MSNNIYIIGFMGSGKTTIAKLLADRIKRKFVDLDDLILNSDQHSYNSTFDIIDIGGEALFRDIESECLIATKRESKQVVACGGGTLIKNDPAKILDVDDRVVYIHAAFETCKSRVENSFPRPLFQDQSLAKVLYSEREPIYRRRAHITVSSENKSEVEVAEEIERALFTL